MGKCTNFADNSISCRRILKNFSGYLISNKPFDFGAHPDHDPDPGILRKYLQLLDRDKYCKNFVRSVALAEVCGLRVLLAFCSQLSHRCR